MSGPEMEKATAGRCPRCGSRDTTNLEPGEAVNDSSTAGCFACGHMWVKQKRRRRRASVSS